ncbi:NAD(P)-binding protein [Plenodomus tracheiphilus IPT5]|uniref:NAD(P)-binding protein n=1 Tax=Plenodomus tracheiphilus IPT5 TaxID=1408161 RepID=A0A6A7BA38_9PLEO|nr:NAD(P)-binding protein [Plenodomus tracheiphilus IPT5]
MDPKLPFSIEPRSTIFVTGVNGLIGSHIVDQLLQRGYNVRGAVRGVEKNTWLKEYFDQKYKDAGLELVEVKDMTIEGCYDGVVNGTDGFIHVASPIGDLTDAKSAIAIGISGALNALKACAKTPSVKRFVFTSSSLAATFPKPNIEFSINETSYNEEAIKAVEKDPSTKNGLHLYSAMKTETEKAAWKWIKEKNPQFVFNTILPNANFGPLLVPEHQGYPSTIEWARVAWTGEYLKEHAAHIAPQWFISPVDTALLHVAALIYSDIKGERLFGFAETWNYNQILETFKELYPERQFAENLEGVGVDCMTVPNERAEEVLRWVKGSGWDGLVTSLGEMSRSWALG